MGEAKRRRAAEQRDLLALATAKTGSPIDFGSVQILDSDIFGSIFEALQPAFTFAARKGLAIPQTKEEARLQEDGSLDLYISAGGSVERKVHVPAGQWRTLTPEQLQSYADRMRSADMDTVTQQLADGIRAASNRCEESLRAAGQALDGVSQVLLVADRSHESLQMVQLASARSSPAVSRQINEWLHSDGGYFVISDGPEAALRWAMKASSAEELMSELLPKLALEVDDLATTTLVATSLPHPLGESVEQCWHELGGRSFGLPVAKRATDDVIFSSMEALALTVLDRSQLGTHGQEAREAHPSEFSKWLDGQGAFFVVKQAADGRTACRDVSDERALMEEVVVPVLDRMLAGGTSTYFGFGTDAAVKSRIETAMQERLTARLQGARLAPLTNLEEHEGIRVQELPLPDRPLTVITIQRAAVEAQNTGPLLSVWNRMIAGATGPAASFQSVTLVFDGYDDDDRVLSEIEEVRAYVGRVTAEFPCWMHLLCATPAELDTMGPWTLCLATLMEKPSLREDGTFSALVEPDTVADALLSSVTACAAWYDSMVRRGDIDEATAASFLMHLGQAAKQHLPS